MVTLERLFLSFNLIAHLLSHGEISPQAIIQSLIRPDRTTLQQTVPPLSDELDEISDRRSNWPGNLPMCVLKGFHVEGSATPNEYTPTALPAYIPCETTVTPSGVDMILKPADYASQLPGTHYYAFITPPDIETGQEKLVFVSHYDRKSRPGTAQEDVCGSADLFMNLVVRKMLKAIDPNNPMQDSRVRAACFDSVGAQTSFLLPTRESGKLVHVTLRGDSPSDTLMFPIQRNADGAQVVNLGGQQFTLGELTNAISAGVAERNNTTYTDVSAFAAGGIQFPPIPEAAPEYVRPTPVPTITPEAVIQPPAKPDVSTIPEAPGLLPTEAPVPHAGALDVSITFDSAETTKRNMLFVEQVNDPTAGRNLYEASLNPDKRVLEQALAVARKPADSFLFIPLAPAYLNTIENPTNKDTQLVASRIIVDSLSGKVDIYGIKHATSEFVHIQVRLKDSYITTTPDTFQIYTKKDGQTVVYLSIKFAAANSDFTSGGSTLPEALQHICEAAVNANEFLQQPPHGYLVPESIKGSISRAGTDGEAESIINSSSELTTFTAFMDTTDVYDRVPSLRPVTMPTGVKAIVQEYLYNRETNTWMVKVVIKRNDLSASARQILWSNTRSDGQPWSQVTSQLIVAWVPEANFAVPNHPPISASQSLQQTTPIFTNYIEPIIDPLAVTVVAGVPHPDQVLYEVSLPPIYSAVATIMHNLSLEPIRSGKTWSATQVSRLARHSKRSPLPSFRPKAV